MISIHHTVQSIADIVNGSVLGSPHTVITSLSRIEDAPPGSLTFLASKNYEKYFEQCQSSCIILHPGHDILAIEGRSYIQCEQPHHAFVALINHLQHEQSVSRQGIHPTAVIASDVLVHETALVDAHVVVGSGARIAAGVHIMSGCSIAANVSVGEQSILHPHVVVEEDCTIGKRCVIHANAVIGSDGFGFLEQRDGVFIKIPQIGNVVIGDDVEIGAGTCIDRAALGSTEIHSGVKLDNLVHVAHNVVVRRNTAVAAQSGIAGGAILGERNRVAGQVGIVGYIETVPDVIIGAQSGVSKSINQPGVYSGSPAVELRQRLKQEAAVRRLTKE